MLGLRAVSLDFGGVASSAAAVADNETSKTVFRNDSATTQDARLIFIDTRLQKLSTVSKL